MVGQIARWIVWLLIASFAVSYAPVLLRLDREALATVGVFALYASLSAVSAHETD
ncbi:MAG: hypothetical protein KAG62_01370 [Caulobacter sp.]|jgi:hypothetical protein|uniref:hypothetical protein n=1 Tax=Caulobacter sp. CCH9-E1 TaxID=1768768 RepID=UPI000B050836|nr:hypothetical protein [Caulobacter sp. CCH9-E1]MCK5908576.1 hypothetical protein [Caulobacter sp.]